MGLLETREPKSVMAEEVVGCSQGQGEQEGT